MDRDARTTLLINQVIAWHNRHPLARRITRAQVTGVGTVALPFVGAKEAGAEGGDAGPVSVLASSHAAQEAELSALEAELDAALSGASPAELAEADGRPASTPAASNTAAPARPAWHPLAWWARWRAARAPEAAPTAPSAPKSARPAAARAAWRVPVFSENFVAPLKPVAVARWARRHAVLELPGAVDGPLREVPVDSGLRRLALRGRQHAAALQTRYVSSAAIEIDDSLRLRCLIGPFQPGTAAAILGPRAWDPRRLALAAGGLMLAMALAAGVAWKLRPAPPADAASTPVAAASEAASASASTEAVAASGVVEATASQADPAASAQPAASAATHGASAAAAVPPHDHAGPHASAPAASSDALSVHGGAAPPAASGAEVSAVQVTPAASAPLGLFLSEEARREVREASEAARAARAAQQTERQERRARAADPDHQPVPGLKPGATVYALVAPLRADKESADLELSRIKSGASLMPYSGSLRFEVLPSNGQWRATWYPFVEKSSAERTRLMLLKRGVTVELVEF